jgi:hypothetical protein
MSDLGLSGTKIRRLDDAVPLAALMAAGLVLSAATILNRPQSTTTTAFLFQDEGLNLLVAQTLLSGGSLYRDVAYPYGPLSAYLHAAFAAVFGNTPLVYLWFLALVSCVNVGLAYALIRKAASVPVATAMTAIGILTVIVIPGSLVGALTTAAYVPLERTLLLLAACCWMTPGSRSLKQSLVIGAVLGAWQGIRFGGAFVAGASIVMVDALYLAFGTTTPRPIAPWIKSLVAIAIGFITVQAVWIAAAFSTLAPGIAWDSVWPLYVLQAYAGWVTPEIRWVAWGGWRLFVAQYLVPLSAGVLGVAGLRHWLISDVEKRVDSRPLSFMGPASGAVFIPLCFFVIGCVSYFRQVQHFRQFMWALVPASAWELQRRGAALRAIVAALWAPGLATVLRSALWSAAIVPPLVTVNLPSGGTIVATPQIARRLQFLERLITSEVRGAPVLYLNSGSGWYFAYGVAHATRHTWLAGFDVIRPYEQEAFLHAFDRTAALVDCNQNQQSPESSSALPILPFPPAIADAMRPRLEPWLSEAGCRVYRVVAPRIRT